MPPRSPFTWLPPRPLLLRLCDPVPSIRFVLRVSRFILRSLRAEGELLMGAPTDEWRLLPRLADWLREGLLFWLERLLLTLLELRLLLFDEERLTVPE